MLNSVKDSLEKRGLNHVKEFLSKELVITEKLDTYRILFENVNGKLTFFKKDNTQIGLIERVLTNVWEDAIIELSIILNDHDIPEGLRFGVAYTPVQKPIRLLYERLPKYILTDVTKRDETTNKVIESFDHNEVKGWAEKFKLGRPPIMFEGKLSENQIEQIIDYAYGKFEKSDSLINIFEKTYSDAGVIEGIIIKSDNILMQQESYEFEMLNEAYQKIESSRDFYDLTVLQINEFMDSYRFPIIKESKDAENNYLEIICNVFNEYCKNKRIHEDLDPNFLVPPSYGYIGKLNLLLLNNKETLFILENGDDVHQSIFKIMLSSFRKYKKPIGLLKESDCQKFNTYVYLINEKCKGKPLGKIPTVELLTENLMEKRSENIVVKELEKRVENSDIDNMRVIASVQKAFKPKARNAQKGEKKCVVYLIDPSPITASHEENIKKLNDVWKCPVLLAYVKQNKRKPGKNFHFSDELKRSQIKALANNNMALSPAFFGMETWDLSEMFKYCRMQYEPAALITEKDLKSEFVVQLYFEEEIMGGRIGVNNDFNIGEMENEQFYRCIRAIEDNDAYTFKELTPASSWGLFDSMVAEHRAWNGTVPMQFKENQF